METSLRICWCYLHSAQNTYFRNEFTHRDTGSVLRLCCGQCRAVAPSCEFHQVAIVGVLENASAHHTFYEQALPLQQQDVLGEFEANGSIQTRWVASLLVKITAVINDKLFRARSLYYSGGAACDGNILPKAWWTRKGPPTRLISRNVLPLRDIIASAVVD